MQYALNRHPDLPDTPTCIEVAKTQDEKDVLSVVMNATEIGKAVLSSPGLPPDRAQALRVAFDAVMRDPDFAAELANARLELTPMRGDKLQTLVADVGAISPDLLAKVKAVYGSAN